jgi:solute:Na+ symporter, SSS family
MVYLAVFIVVYLIILVYLSYIGYRKTTTVSDYLLAGRQVHPFTMALSYGSTFISTAAVIGFGGMSALFGFALNWLAFLNILVGVWISFIFFGKRTRKMGKALDAHTFPELLGRRYESRFIQGFSGLLIFFFMPLYAAAILIAISRFIEVYTGFPFSMALVVFLLITACYVIWGGMKGVLYTSVFQGLLLVVVMVIICVSTYASLGGLVKAHHSLSELLPLVPADFQQAGHRGFTSMPRMGSELWWYVVTTLIMGVGIGVLGQPQLNVRFMTLKSDREINRSIPFAALFLLLTSGVAYLVGPLTNVLFSRRFGELSITVAGWNVDKVIPQYIDVFYPQWFGAVFLVAMMSTAMGTVSGQFHALGTSLSRDFFEQALLRGRPVAETTIVTRVGIVFGILITLILGLVLPESIVAAATAFFFSLCGATFIPAYLFALYWKRGSKSAAKASVLSGFFSSLIWIVFFHEMEAKAIGFTRTLFGCETLLGFPWNVIDPQIVALPISFIVFIVVSLCTEPVSKDTLQKAFRHI